MPSLPHDFASRQSHSFPHLEGELHCLCRGRVNAHFRTLQDERHSEVVQFWKNVVEGPQVNVDLLELLSVRKSGRIQVSEVSGFTRRTSPSPDSARTPSPRRQPSVNTDWTVMGDRQEVNLILAGLRPSFSWPHRRTHGDFSVEEIDNHYER